MQILPITNPHRLPIGDRLSVGVRLSVGDRLSGGDRLSIGDRLSVGDSTREITRFSNSKQWQKTYV